MHRPHYQSTDHSGAETALRAENHHRGYATPTATENEPHRGREVARTGQNRPHYQSQHQEPRTIQESSTRHSEPLRLHDAGREVAKLMHRHNARAPPQCQSNNSCKADAAPTQSDKKKGDGTPPTAFAF